ncbi:MAG TPA: hypothetical protein VH986_07540 [Acidimicrobiia bacterium]
MPDSKTPTPGEITIMAGGAVALIGSFLHFYSVDTSFGSGSVSAWGSGLFPVATLMVIFAVISAVLVAVTKFANVQLPERVLTFTWTQVYLVLGFFAALYAIAYLLVNKGGYDFGIGFWLILIGCLASLVGAILLLRERATTSGPGSPGVPPPTA